MLQLLCFGLLMLAINALLPFADFTFTAQQISAAVVALCGLLLVLAGGALFRKYATTFNPLKPGNASTLVTTGVYRYTRNPMYLGFLLILTAWCIYIGNLINILLLPLFIVSITSLNIKPEEQALANKFGQQYAAYASRIRRWL